MKSLTFLIEGSQPEPYSVIFEKTARDITVTCNCAAGMANQLCKHRINLFVGDITGLISENKSDVATALEWLSTSQIKQELQTLSELETEMEKLKNNIKNKKKQLARLCNGN